MKKIYRIVYLLLCILAFILQGRLLTDNPRQDLFIFYTNLSILFSFLYYLVTILGSLWKKDYQENQTWKWIMMMCVIVTFLIYNLVLRPYIAGLSPAELTQYLQKFNSAGSLGDSLVHVVLPLLVLGDYLLFDEKGKTKNYDVILWLVFPLLYCLFTLVRALLFGEISGMGTRFPYPFMDMDKLGIISWVRNIIILLFAFVCLGYLFYRLDHYLAKRIENKKG